MGFNRFDEMSSGKMTRISLVLFRSPTTSENRASMTLSSSRARRCCRFVCVREREREREREGEN